MKKFLITALTISAMSVFACWFTESSFNATYIASVNGKVIHYVPATSMAQAVYKNGEAADLPITVQIKVSDRMEAGQALSIKTAELQYKIIRQNGTSTTFKTVKIINNPSWKMNFNSPVNLFGRDGIINIPEGQIEAGDEIIIRVWFNDSIYTTGDRTSDIDKNQVPDTQTQNNITIGTDGWAAPHVFRIKFSGKRRLMI